MSNKHVSFTIKSYDGTEYTVKYTWLNNKIVVTSRVDNPYELNNDMEACLDIARIMQIEISSMFK